MPMIDKTKMPVKYLIQELQPAQDLTPEVWLTIFESDDPAFTFDMLVTFKDPDIEGTHRFVINATMPDGEVTTTTANIMKFLEKPKTGQVFKKMVF